MASTIPQCLFKRSLTIERSVFSRACNSRQSRNLSYTRPANAAASSQNPAHEILSRPFQRPEVRARHAASSRLFSSTARRSYKSVEEAKSRYRLGPFSWQAGLLFLGAGAILTVYFRYEKDRMNRARIAQHSKGMGRPLVGGPFQLIDHNNQPFSEQDMKGKYALVYFGFTHCPDICPEELDKMAGMIDKVKATHGDVMKPIFISCDPARDTPEVIKAYLAEFHEDMLGLTGEYQQIKDTCKAYRVYFSTPQEVKPGQDYLVDHSIYFYLMDPDGDFVEAIGRNFTVDAAAKVINDHISDWRGKLDKS